MMGMRYKKVYILYSALALLGVFALKSLILKPAVQLFQLRSIRMDVSRLETAAGKQGRYTAAMKDDVNTSIRETMLSVLDCVGDAGCPVLSGAPTRRKSPEACPIYDIDIVFSGNFNQIISALSSIDSLLGRSTFRVGVSSCRMDVERSSNRREWNLVCRERIQCAPSLVSATRTNSESVKFTGDATPFHIPSIRGRKQAPATESGLRPKRKPARISPNARLVGRIGSGSDAIIIVEAAGESLQLRKGDGSLLKDYGDSVRFVANGIDTLTARKK